MRLRATFETITQAKNHFHRIADTLQHRVFFLKTGCWGHLFFPYNYDVFNFKALGKIQKIK